MTHLDRVLLSLRRGISIWTPWPATTVLILIIFLGLSLGWIEAKSRLFHLVASDVANGQLWRLITGTVIQPARTPVDWLVALVAAGAVALLGREIEERSGGARLLVASAILAFTLSLCVFGLQCLWNWGGHDVGWQVPLTGYPAVSALAAYRIVQSPFGRLGSSDYRIPTWIAAFAYGILTYALLLQQPWPILLSGHLLAVVLGVGLGVAAQRRWQTLVGQLTACPPLADPSGSAPLGDEDLDERLDRILATIAERGLDSLDSADWAVLREAARRRRSTGKSRP